MVPKPVKLRTSCVLSVVFQFAFLSLHSISERCYPFLRLLMSTRLVKTRQTAPILNDLRKSPAGTLCSNPTSLLLCLLMLMLVSYHLERRLHSTLLHYVLPVLMMLESRVVSQTLLLVDMSQAGPFPRSNLHFCRVLPRLIASPQSLPDRTDISTEQSHCRLILGETRQASCSSPSSKRRSPPKSTCQSLSSRNL